MRKYWHYIIYWLWQTPERSLNAAYNATLEIKRIENEYFGGKEISFPAEYSENVVTYIKAELFKYLQIIQNKLTEFKLSRFILNLCPIDVSSFSESSDSLEVEKVNLTYDNKIVEVKAVICETINKLKFIEKTVAKYQKLTLIKKTRIDSVQPNEEVTNNKVEVLQNKYNKLNLEKKLVSRTSLGKTSVIPRSIGRTLEKLKRDLNPKAELEVIQEFRRSRYRTIVSIRYLLILALVPFLVNQLAKEIIISPLVNSFWNNNQSNVYLNFSQEERAFTELKSFEEKIRFDFLAGITLKLTPDITEKKLKQKAYDLAQNYKIESNNARKSIFADLLSATTFVALLVIGNREIAMFKFFIDEIIYGLSDSAKAFLIILFTDLLVGFHSSHGWEVILENTLKHFGLPENKDFIFMFIATFPVILDVTFKYWLFRYLNRVSPSAVATYHNMNE